jgi:hypothetical protein
MLVEKREDFFRIPSEVVVAVLETSGRVPTIQTSEGS